VVETSAFLGDFQDALEAQILKSAVIGALQCTSGNDVFGSKERVSVPMSTGLIGNDCVANESFCTVMETEFVIIAGDVNPETRGTAAFLAYIKLQDDMDGGVFVDEIPVLDRVKYRSPLPLLPPPITSPDDIPVLQEIEDSSSSGKSTTESLGLSPWTYGAVMAMCKLSLMSVLAQSKG
jgi:hypothetical protein